MIFLLIMEDLCVVYALYWQYVKTDVIEILEYLVVNTKAIAIWNSMFHGATL